jgi:hypothetical protein
MDRRRKVATPNSFYMDEPAYLFLLLSVVLYLRVMRWHRRRDAILLIIASLLLTTAKTQHAPLGLFIAVLFCVTRRSLWRPSEKTVLAAAGCLVLASLLMLWKGTPPGYSTHSLYTVTFRQILPHSKNVDRTLTDLGLDNSYRPLIGKTPLCQDQ